MIHAALLSATASPPCTLNIPAHNVHYDLRGVPGVSGIYQGSSDRSVNEGLAEASELLQAGHRSQPWFDITSYDVAAEAQGSRRRCALAGLGVEADPPRRTRGEGAAGRRPPRRRCGGRRRVARGAVEEPLVGVWRVKYRT